MQLLAGFNSREDGTSKKHISTLELMNGVGPKQRQMLLKYMG